jgi:hypothetical protein
MTRDLTDDIDDILDSITNRQIETSIKKSRGLNGRSQWLIKNMIPIVKAAKPITGRGVGYKLFVAKLIKSMSQNDMQRVYRLLKVAREQGMIPWGSIVDEARQLERRPSWPNPKEFVESAVRQYRRDFWEQQPSRCEVWAEKGTIRGVLQPVLDAYGVGLRVMHGYSSATTVNDVADDPDARPLTALYVGDWDPSGLHMSEVDLPKRLESYGGDHVKVLRVALTEDQLAKLPWFYASDKSKDPRYDWFTYAGEQGNRCWEIDALDPNELRDRVEHHIKTCILNHDAWERCELVCEAERDSLRHVLTNWGDKHAKPST